MKGIDNNAEAKKLEENILNSQSNKIRNLYNLGYKQGYEDGMADAVERIKEKIIDGR